MTFKTQKTVEKSFCYTFSNENLDYKYIKFTYVYRVEFNYNNLYVIKYIINILINTSYLYTYTCISYIRLLL